MRASIYRSNSLGTEAILHTKFATVIEIFSDLIEFQANEKNYDNIFYANINGGRVYSDGTGESYLYFEDLTTDLIELMYKRALTTCTENSTTILRFKKELRRRKA